MRALNVAATEHGDVERCLQGESVELMERGGARSAGKGFRPAVEDERGEVGARRGCRERAAKRVWKDLVEDAALDSASKLVRAQPRHADLLGGDGSVLTCRGVRHPAECIRHAGSEPRHVLPPNNIRQLPSLCHRNRRGSPESVTQTGGVTGEGVWTGGGCRCVTGWWRYPFGALWSPHDPPRERHQVLFR